MNASRSRLSLLALVAALGLLLAPHSALAGGAKAVKPLPARTQKVADKVLSSATAAQKAKAMESLATAMAGRKDLRMSTTKQAAYLKRSLSAQNGAANRTAGKKPALAKNKKPKTAKKKKGQTAGAVDPAAPAAEESQAAGTDDGLGLTGGPTEAESDGGIMGRIRRYRAARAEFRALAAGTPELGEELTMRTRLRRSGFSAFISGGATALAVVGILSGGTLLALGGGGVAIAGGVREYLRRDAVRKELVQELAADKQLDKESIATFEAAGWL